MNHSKRRHLLQLSAAGIGLAAGLVVWKSRQDEADAEGSNAVGADSDNSAEAGLQAFWKMELQGLNQPMLKMQAFRGKPLLINFWATWCPPCVAEMPLLERIYQQNASKNIQILGIAADKVEAVQTFVKLKGIHFPIAIGGAEAIALSKKLGNPLGSLPFSVFVNPDASVQRLKIGELHEDDVQIWLKSVN